MERRIGMNIVDPGLAGAVNIAPVAPYTWEVQAELDNDTQETGRIPLRWNRPVEIVGFYASVRQTTSKDLIIPTVDDIAISMSANQEDRFTNRLEDALSTGASESFVTLGSLTTQVPRLVRLQLTNASPQIDVNFRWKPQNDVSSPIYESALASLAFYCRYL